MRLHLLQVWASLCSFYTVHFFPFFMGSLVSALIAALTVAMPYLKDKARLNPSDHYSTLGGEEG